jgi:hypothetical protein
MKDIVNWAMTAIYERLSTRKNSNQEEEEEGDRGSGHSSDDTILLRTMIGEDVEGAGSGETFGDDAGGVAEDEVIALSGVASDDAGDLASAGKRTPPNTNEGDDRDGVNDDGDMSDHERREPIEADPPENHEGSVEEVEVEVEAAATYAKASDLL